MLVLSFSNYEGTVILYSKGTFKYMTLREGVCSNWSTIMWGRGQITYMVAEKA